MVVKNQLWNDARVKKEALTLAGAGLSVTILCQPEAGAPSTELWNGIEIVRVPRSGRLRGSIRRALDAAEKGSGAATRAAPGILARIRRNRLRRTLGDLLYAFLYQARLLRAALAAEADVYHAHDLDTLAVCAVAASARGAKLVYDSHELWLESTRHLSETPQPFRLLEKLTEKFLAPRADEVISVTPGRSAVMERMYPSMPVPFLVPNYPPLVVPAERSTEIRKELGVVEEPCFLFLYQGIICHQRGLEQLLAASAHLRGSPVRISIVGHDASGGAIRRLAEELGVLDMVFFHPPVSSEQLHRLTGSADAGLILFQGNCLNHTLSLPNKLFEYMISSIPILSCDLPEIASVLAEHGNGVAVDASDPSAIARAMLQMAGDPAAAAEMGRRGREAAASLYTWSRSEEALLELYSGLTGGEGNSAE
jgi:glycosyltransferase involved in cell wall biosynthesis